MTLLEPSSARPRLGFVRLGAVIVLLGWSPLSLALTTASAWPRLVHYGWPAWSLFAARVAVVALGIAAARLLLDRAAGAARLASLALGTNALLVLATSATPYFPSNAVPSTKWLTAWALVLAHLALAGLVRRSPDATA